MKPEASSIPVSLFADFEHLLRTQLNIILGHSQLLALKPDLDEYSHNQIQEIDQACHVMLDFIENFSPGPAEISRKIPPPPHLPDAPRHQKILIVEDDPTNRAVIGLQFESLGYPVEIVTNGIEALECWHTGIYDLILSDINMLGMNGYELARTIRREEGGRREKRVPIIALTAASGMETWQACQAAGMDDMLPKPIELEALCTLLRRYSIQSQEDVLPAWARNSDTDIVELFCNTTQEALAGCHRLIHDRNTSALASIIHTLKSSALSIGARQISQQARDMEEQVLKGEWSELDMIVKSLDEAVLNFRQADKMACTHINAPLISSETIRQAIASNAFEPLFWIRVDIASLMPVGVDVQFSWHDPERGSIPSEVFLFLAEQYGYIDALSELLLTQVLVTSAHMERAGFPLKISFPMSSCWLRRPHLGEFILASIKAVGGVPERLTLEIAARSCETAATLLSGLVSAGVVLSVGNFQHCPHSPEQLRRLGFSEIRLDIKDWSRYGSSPALMTHELIRVATGVDNTRNLKEAHTLGANHIQGKLIAPSMPETKLLKWLSSRL